MGGTTTISSLSVTAAANFSGVAAAFNGVSSLTLSGWQLGPSGTASYSGMLAYSIFSTDAVLSSLFVASSDRRLKSDFVPIKPEDGIAYCLGGCPMTYELQGQGRRAGFIAQDDIRHPLRKIAVSLAPDESMKADDDSPEGFRFMRDESADNPYLTAAIVYLLHRIAALEAKLNP
jgi:hypothetical protein